MTSCPQAHLDYVKEVNNKLGGKVKPLIRFVKAWAYYNNVPIKSFYLEMWVARYASGENAILYSLDLKRIFHQLEKNGLASMFDPTGLTGLISPCKTDNMLEEAKKKISSAASRSERAYELESNGDNKAAFSTWDLLFGYRFPSY
jgi:hypothetical protein